MLYKCVDCGQEIAGDAYRCPHCNAADAGYRASRAAPAAGASEYESEADRHIRLKAGRDQEPGGPEQEAESPEQEAESPEQALERQRLAAEAARAQAEADWAKDSEDPKLVFTWMAAASAVILCLSLWLYFR